MNILDLQKITDESDCYTVESILHKHELITWM